LKQDGKRIKVKIMSIVSTAAGKRYNKKHILINAYTNVNLGDDLFLKILFERYPQVEFIIIAQNKVYKQWKTKYENITLINPPMCSMYSRLFLKLFSFLKKDKLQQKYMCKKYQEFYLVLGDKIDAYVHIGGSLFQQYQPGILLNHKIDELIVNMYKAKPKYIIGANFGPYIEFSFLEYYRSIFGKYDDICFRESYSYDIFKNISNVRYEMDIVFSHAFDVYKKIKNSIGLSLINLSFT
jgi:colanic acid/amylovoran biosynthesis protein